ncbi:MAG TPA: hypothetical protein VE594_06530 [Nitrososphaeraceae archaeon]|nr:hypothetical protein [Nitrososphaeraceae archaeon]
MPILHFSGRFRSYPPLYNNYPWNPEKYFDPDLSPDDVMQKVTEKVEPLQYFEFEFFDVYIRKITYNDGISTTSEKDDPLIGKEIKLKGLLVDVSPHIEKGRLFAGELRIIDFILGKLNVAVQSDLFRTIRNTTDRGAKTLSADFESALYDIHNLKNEFVKEENSRFIREIGNNNDKNLKIYFNVNSFDFLSLEGKVYGYVGPYIPTENKYGVKIHGRRLLIDPSVSSELRQDFRIQEGDLEPVDNVLRKDLEGSYEIIEENKVAVVRYLNAIPFSDRNHSPPEGYRFSIILFENGKQTETSSSSPSPPRIIELGENNISKDGGICIFKIPENIREVDRVSIQLKAAKNKNEPQTFMVEPKYDLILDNDQKFLILGSAKKKEEVRVRVYKNNRLSIDDNIELILKSEKNDRSPTVASWTSPNTASKNGIALCYIETLDLENCKEGVEDPVLSVFSGDDTTPVTISGELPWDRYYGNYLSLKIQSTEKHIIKANIPVRVLHSVRAEYINNIDDLDKEKIQEIVTKILSYYTRYYPWLHVRYRYARDQKDGIIKPIYNQFLKIKEFLNFAARDDVHDWHSAQETIDKINHFLERLERDDHDWRKMPRSRDFPVNGIEFLKAWKASLINKVLEDIKENKRKIIEDDNNDKISEMSLDLNNWGEVENLVSRIDNLISFSPSLSIEQKKVLLMCKVAIYDHMLEKVGISRSQTGHLHSH